VGRLEAVHGEYAWAQGERPGYYAQATTAVFAKGHSVLDAFLSRHNVGAETGRTYLGQFLFAGDDVEKLVDDLSGGERSRLALAALLYSHPNVMLLDEPTNHLDITAREALEAALAAFAGTLVLISHDRFLIDRLATEVWAIEDGRLAVYDGNWSDFDVGRGRRVLSYSEREQVRAQPSTLSRAPAEISAELKRMQAETVPVLTRLAAMAPSAPVDLLEQLVATYEEIQTRIVAATTQFLSD
jgi:ATP-binding cassette subfamily F protein 3